MRFKLLLIVALMCIPGEALAATLVGYWDFDELTGDAVYDQSSFGNDGYLTGATRSAGKVGGGLSFDGFGVTIPNSPSLNSMPGGYTMSAWINPASFDEFNSIFWKTDRDNRIHMLHFQVGDNVNLPADEGRLYSALNKEVGSGGFEGITPRVVPLDDWSFVALTYDESFQRFYLNGNLIFSAAFSEPWVGNNVDLLIGQHQVFDFAGFFGQIDETRIYRGAQTRAEILTDMQYGLVPEVSSLVLFGLGIFALAAINKR